MKPLISTVGAYTLISMTVTDFLNDWKYYGKIKKDLRYTLDKYCIDENISKSIKSIYDISPIYLKYGTCIKMYEIIPTILIHK